MVDLQTDTQTEGSSQCCHFFCAYLAPHLHQAHARGGGTRNLECISLGRFFSSLRFGLATIGAGIPCDDFKSAKFIRP